MAIPSSPADKRGGSAPHYLSRAGRAEPAKAGVRLPTSSDLLERARVRAAAMASGAPKMPPRSWSRHMEANICPECEAAGLHRRRCSRFQASVTVPPKVARRFQRGLTTMAWAGLQDARAGVVL